MTNNSDKIRISWVRWFCVGLFIFELIQQPALVNFLLFLIISFEHFEEKNAFWALVSLKSYKAFRIAQC